MAWAIPFSHDWQRVNQLPIWQLSAAEIDHWRDLLHRFCLSGSAVPERLLDTQVQALVHWAQKGYFFGNMPVGSGKTLLTFLMPRFFSHRQAVLMVPASLRAKTIAEFQEYKNKGWALDQPPLVVSYEQLQTAKSADMLEQINPDILICDEADAFKNIKAARTRRFLRFVRSHPDTHLAALSGSFMRKSIMEFWHLLLMTHGVDAPVPLSASAAKRWADAIDAGVDDSQRPAAGALSAWCSPEQLRYPQVLQARTGFRNRLGATPGVLLGQDAPLFTELEIRERVLTAPPPVKDALALLYGTWETPNGDLLETGFDVWRHARELLAGFWYRWEPAPPATWLLARRAWHKFVRTELGKEIPGLDSPLQVANAHAGHPLLLEWQRVRPEYEINTVPVWVSDYVIDDALAWSSQHSGGIVWVEHRAVGERLHLRGLEYFGAGAQASKAILYHHGPMAASIHAHRKGKNLQRYHDNLVVTPPTSTAVWEQMLGRTYRHGQDETVSVAVYLHEEALQKAMEQALDEADTVSMTKGVAQRLTRAYKLLPSLDGDS